MSSDSTSDQQGTATTHTGTWIGKGAELLVLGLIVGAFSIALSFLWKGYVYKTSDIVQYYAVAKSPKLLFHLVLIDIGERTCQQWAKESYDGWCAGLPHFPHAELAQIFGSITKAKPRLVVVDLDLRTEQPGAGPFAIDVDSLTDDENKIRSYVKGMDSTPFVIAQPLIRQPQQHQPEQYDYRLEATILHKLEKPNMRFGQVEQELADDGVIRRFVSTVAVTHQDKFLNPDAPGPMLVEHLALRVCELVTDAHMCGRQGVAAQAVASGTHPLRFGSHEVSANQAIQFPYLLQRDLSRLGPQNVAVIEARAVTASNFDASSLDDAVVVIGSTARGRGDHHVTPLDAFGGDTAGVVVLANEVAAALSDKRLESPGWLPLLLEKLILILLSTWLILFGFWYWHSPAGNKQAMQQNKTQKMRKYSLRTGHFILIITATFLLNVAVMWFVSFRYFGYGELIDPVTPVVAAVLDILVDICAIVGGIAAFWAERWQHVQAKTQPRKRT
jgi:CHASE2 domain-containing sensor protein